MRGRPPKRAEQRQDRRPSRQKVIVLRPPAPKPPRPPQGLLPKSRAVWRAYWQSDVARAVDLGADGFLLERWIRAVDEWARTRPVFERSRLVEGSMGQPVLNPLAGYLGQLEKTITHAEEQLGLTPVARIRLGIAVGQAKLTAAALNASLDARQVRQAGEDPEFAEWATGWALDPGEAQGEPSA